MAAGGRKLDEPRHRVATGLPWDVCWGAVSPACPVPYTHSDGHGLHPVICFQLFCTLRFAFGCFPLPRHYLQLQDNSVRKKYVYMEISALVPSALPVPCRFEHLSLTSVPAGSASPLRTSTQQGLQDLPFPPCSCSFTPGAKFTRWWAGGAAGAHPAPPVPGQEP